MRKVPIAALFASLPLVAEPAFAHHVMGGKTPETFVQGLLSGLGHPLIGLDHFAAVVAVGCLAAAHRRGFLLGLGFVVAMMLGVAMHLQGTTVPGSELLVALSVIGLGAIVVWRRDLPATIALALFALVGALHGYALGESIFGAETSPLAAYLIGLALVQSVVALAAMSIAAAAFRRSDPVMVRLIGAGVAGIGIAVLMQQVVPAV